MIDCVVVGGGPAGLTAAIYLARFHLSVQVIDAGESRASSIPRTRNHAGYPGGISGKDLITRMATQADEYGAGLTAGRVTELTRVAGGFGVLCDSGDVTARAVLLATGVFNRRPPMQDDLHDEALARGLLRYCPICDGFEVTDKRVAVIGNGRHGLQEAIFLRSFTADVTLLSLEGELGLDEIDVQRAQDANIKLSHGPISSITIGDSELCLRTPRGIAGFQSVYPALGSIIRSDLARSLGADMSDEGCLLVDTHQRTTCAGLYAAGDVVMGLDQISHAMGEGGVAATTIRNDLAKMSPLFR